MRYGRMGGNGRNPEIRTVSTFARVSPRAEKRADRAEALFDCTSAREMLSHARKAL